MSKKIKYIVAAVLAAVVCVAVIFTINRKKSGINMNVGELSGDEQNYWNPDIHRHFKGGKRILLPVL